MNKQFTASEVRDIAWSLDGLSRQMLRAYADLLEAQERAVPVAWRQKHLAPDESQIGWILTETRPAHFYCEPLYTHPDPADAERLAEALRAFPEDPNPFTYRRCYANARAALAAHCAQAQPPAASATPNLASYWRIVAEAAEVLQMVLDSGVKLPPNWRGPLLDELSGLSAMMLAAAPQQAAEPKGWMASDNTGRVIDAKAKTAGSRAAATASATAIYSIPLYTHPQPAQDASKYQELLMAVEKKFPGESRHETALRYIRETELQSCEPKCDAAMAKESGR